MGNQDNTIKKEIQDVAVELIKMYRSKESEKHEDATQIIKEPLINEKFFRLIDLILEYYNKNERTILFSDKTHRKVPDNNAWYKVAHYVLKVIPNYEEKTEDGTSRDFINYFGRIYKQNQDRIVDLPDDQAVNDNKEDVRGRFWGMLNGNTNKEREIRKMMKRCNSAGIDINNASEFTVDRIRKEMEKEAAEHGKTSKFNEKKVREYLGVIEVFSQFGSLDYQNEFLRGLNEIDFKNGKYKDVKDGKYEQKEIKKLLESDREIIIGFLAHAKEEMTDNVKKRDRRILRCLYSNDIASYFREYASEKDVDEYWSSKSKQKQLKNKAKLIDYELKPFEEELYRSLLLLDYLSYVLEDPEPNTIKRICLNDFRKDEEEKEIHFTDESVARFSGLKSKSSIIHTYRSKFEEMNRKLYNYLIEYYYV